MRIGNYSSMKPHRLPLHGWAALLMVVTGTVVAGCRSFAPVPAENVVMVDGRGRLVDPTGNVACRGERGRCEGKHSWLKNYPVMPGDEVEPYYQAILDAMQQQPPAADGRRRVMIFIHGGLNTQVATVKRVVKLHDAIQQAGYYPIFINWQSSLISSYFDHLFNIRQGEPWGWKGWWMAPVYLGTDVVRGVARAPMVWSYLIWNDIKTWPNVFFPKQEAAREIADEIKATPGSFPFSEGVKDRGRVETAGSFLTWLITSPTKLLTAPFIDAFGTSAWDNMLRRTDMLFHTDAEFGLLPETSDAGGTGDGYLSLRAQGALADFLRRLVATVEATGGAEKWDITLVGHSMGTIVLNQILRDFGETAAGPVPFNRLVYMAAACTLDDYESSVFPYLQANPEAQVYHLTLHDVADMRDRWEPIRYIDPPPRGSLLVWIDSFLSDPETPLDRTAGRFSNLMVALHDTPDKLRPRIHIKEFNAGGKFAATDPQKHGDFSRPFHFWEPACWEPGDEHPASCMKDVYDK